MFIIKQMDCKPYNVRFFVKVFGDFSVLWIFSVFGFIRHKINKHNNFYIFFINPYTNSLFFNIKHDVNIYSYKTSICEYLFGLHFWYFYYFTLTGVGFKGLLRGYKLYFFLGFSHIIFLNLNNFFYFKIKKTWDYLFSIVGFSKVSVSQILLSWFMLKRLDIYNNKGFYKRGAILKQKVGKVSQQ